MTRFERFFPSFEDRPYAPYIRELFEVHSQTIQAMIAAWKHEPEIARANVKALKEGRLKYKDLLRVGELIIDAEKRMEERKKEWEKKERRKPLGKKSSIFPGSAYRTYRVPHSDLIVLAVLKRLNAEISSDPGDWASVKAATPYTFAGLGKYAHDYTVQWNILSMGQSGVKWKWKSKGVRKDKYGSKKSPVLEYHGEYEAVTPNGTCYVPVSGEVYFYSYDTADDVPEDVIDAALQEDVQFAVDDKFDEHCEDYLEYDEEYDEDESESRAENPRSAPPMPRIRRAMADLNALASRLIPGFVPYGLRHCYLAELDHAAEHRVVAHTIHIPNTVCVAADLELLPDDILYGILAHEFGHILAEKHYGRTNEPDADRASKEFLGLPIFYRSEYRLEYLKPDALYKAMNPSMRVQNPSVGKHIYGRVYVHRDYEHTLPQGILSRAKKAVERDFPSFRYNVVSMGDRSHQGDVVTFTWSPDFDTAKYPSIRKQVTVSAQGKTQLREYNENPPIYHKKGLFVEEGYPRFSRDSLLAFGGKSSAPTSLKQRFLDLFLRATTAVDRGDSYQQIVPIFIESFGLIEESIATIPDAQALCSFFTEINTTVEGIKYNNSQVLHQYADKFAREPQHNARYLAIQQKMASCQTQSQT